MTDLMKIAIMGYGTVGSGVFHLMRKNAAAIEDRLGWGLSVKYVLDLRDFKGAAAEPFIVHDFETIANDKEVKIVVETMGGLHPAYDFTKRLLEAGKSVCTSNKELVAEHGIELMALARQNNVNYMFEASCGGGERKGQKPKKKSEAGEPEEIKVFKQELPFGYK